MFAAIPFFTIPVYEIPLGELGTLPIDPWFTLVCVGFVVGLEIARARGIRLGLDVRDVVDGALFIVVSGFLVGHVFTVLAYHPERLRTEGIMAILRFWTGFSSMGGFIGAVIGAVVFYNWVRPRDAWKHADVIAFGFPFGWFFGRVGCGIVHDHIGKETTFPLAMRFPDSHYAAGVRHELGLYEAAFTLLISVAFYVMSRQERRAGFYLAMFGILYAPIRFGLDFLRAEESSFGDARYFGLTPGHYGSLVMFAASVVLMVWLHRRPVVTAVPAVVVEPDPVAVDAPEPEPAASNPGTAE